MRPEDVTIRWADVKVESVALSSRTLKDLAINLSALLGGLVHLKPVIPEGLTHDLNSLILKSREEDAMRHVDDHMHSLSSQSIS